MVAAAADARPAEPNDAVDLDAAGAAGRGDRALALELAVVGLMRLEVGDVAEALEPVVLELELVGHSGPRSGRRR